MRLANSFTDQPNSTRRVRAAIVKLFLSGAFTRVNVVYECGVDNKPEQSSRKKVQKRKKMSSELLSHRLLSFRERHGLTQTDLAALLGITPRYVSTLENGTREVDPNTSIYRLFAAYENGQVPVRGSNANHHTVVREEPPSYRSDSVGTVPARGGLSANDVLAQVRADLAMIEGGPQSEKRRAYYFLREVHLPMLAKAFKLEP